MAAGTVIIFAIGLFLGMAIGASVVCVIAALDAREDIRRWSALERSWRRRR